MESNSTETNKQRASREFADYMYGEYLARTDAKYELAPGIDLASFGNRIIFFFLILKYGIRSFKGKGKKHDPQKIAHYASMIWHLDREAYE